jgi:two-component system, LytTR family, response regulator
VLLDLAAVDWIETQGNYLGLHAGGTTHLVRGALRAFEPRLDPARFARVHRRIVVALDRVVEVTALEGGDADLRLRDGAVVRLSRSYRKAVRERL